MGSKNPTSDNKSQITVLSCANAAGYCIPPFIIFGCKNLSPEMVREEIPGTIYGLSDSGWMDRELFLDWFTQHFLMHAPSARPLILLMDGHSSHYDPTTISIAAEEKVILFLLPPNTTHLTQPLDKSGFGPLKNKWKEVCHKFIPKNPGRVITPRDFSPLFSQAWHEAMSMKTICHG